MDQALEDWLADRPQIIKDLARSHPPDGEYRLADDRNGDLYLIYSYNEDGTITATRCSRLTRLFMWNVFGMKPEDLVRTDE